MTNDSLDKLTAEYIQRLGKMSITELEDMRPVLVEELVKQGVGKKAEIYCLAMFDLVIKKKKEKVIAKHSGQQNRRVEEETI